MTREQSKPSSFKIKAENDLKIADFCDMTKFEQMMKDWAIGTGLATVAVGKDGKYISGSYNFTEFCSELTRKSPEGLRRCIKCDKEGRGIYRCHSGLIDFASPITLEDGTLLGSIIGGQVLPEKPDEQRFRETARELGIDEEKYIAALRKVNVRSKEEIQASFDMLTSAVNLYVRMSYAAKVNSQSLYDRMKIISSLSKIYFFDCYIDLNDGGFQVLDTIQKIRKITEQSHDAKTMLKNFEHHIKQEFASDFASFADIGTLQERMRGRQSISFEFVSEDSVWCRASFITVSTDAKSNVSKVIFAIQNVQEEKEKEIKTRQILKESASEAIRANNAKTDFLSRMSHDIRTPLNGIIGMTYLARQEKNGSKTSECLDKIEISSKFLLGLINDVLDMAKIESNKIVLHPEPYSASEITDYLNSVISPLCQEKNHHFTIDIKVDENRVPVVDKLRFNQIIFNLLSNAVKFTPEGGSVSFKAQFTKADEPNKLKMTALVSDTGKGISEEFQKILFTPFSQEDRSDTALNRGSGLGLAICKNLISLMGGTISVKSKLGQGTVFKVEVMLDSISEAEYAEKEKKTEQRVKSSSLSGLHILLCEDHPLNQEIAKAILEKSGAIVEIADNGEIGLAKFRKSSVGYYDVVLMDIRMPIKNGYETAEEIRALKRKDAARVPIIAMTADAFDDDVKKCLNAGMDSHIAKPIDPQRTVIEIENQIDSKKSSKKQ
jgi:signal transduction histidine kinase/ligand-binding sensor protein/ActR/RegA family two-component response regulator